MKRCYFVYVNRGDARVPLFLSSFVSLFSTSAADAHHPISLFFDSSSDMLHDTWRANGRKGNKGRGMMHLLMMNAPRIISSEDEDKDWGWHPLLKWKRHLTLNYQITP